MYKKVGHFPPSPTYLAPGGSDWEIQIETRKDLTVLAVFSQNLDFWNEKWEKFGLKTPKIKGFLKVFQFFVSKSLSYRKILIAIHP